MDKRVIFDNGNGGVSAIGNCLVGWSGIYATTVRIGVSDNNTDTSADAQTSTFL